MTMPAWSLYAAGHVPDTQPPAIPALRDQLAAVLSDPAWGAQISSFHADGDEPVRAVLHEG